MRMLRDSNPPPNYKLWMAVAHQCLSAIGSVFTFGIFHTTPQQDPAVMLNTILNCTTGPAKCSLAKMLHMVGKLELSLWLTMLPMTVILFMEIMLHMTASLFMAVVLHIAATLFRAGMLHTAGTHFIDIMFHLVGTLHIHGYDAPQYRNTLH
jgi:hypothetical protein